MYWYLVLYNGLTSSKGQYPSPILHMVPTVPTAVRIVFTYPDVFPPKTSMRPRKKYSTIISDSIYRRSEPTIALLSLSSAS